METGPYTCPRCQSKLRIRDRHTPHRDKDSLDCPVCGQEITRWNGTRIYSAEVIERREPDGRKN